MEGILHSFFWWIINLEIFVPPLLLVGVILLWTRFKKISCLCLTTAVTILFVFLMPFAKWGVICLENRFPQVQELPEDVTGIILLGGSFDFATTHARKQISYNIAGGRLVAFSDLAQKYPATRLVFSGGGVIPSEEVSEAALMKQLLPALAINPNRIVFEGKSKNTRENATFSYKKIQPKADEKWVLVTSAVQMPRAMGNFRKAGWTNIIAYPVDYHTTGSYPFHPNLSLLDSILAWRFGIREYASLVSSYIFGYSDELMPSP